MATDYKGKYKGPDLLKGNAAKLKAWRSAGKPKDVAAWLKTYKKATPLKDKANELATAQYAGTIAELNSAKESNLRQYEDAMKQRQEALSGQIGSNKTAGAITGNAVTGLKGEALALYEKNKAAATAISDVRDKTAQAANSNTLTLFEAAMRARGIDPTQSKNMAANLEQQQGYMSELDRINANSTDSSQERANSLYDLLSTQVSRSTNSANANAEAAARSDLTEGFNQYASRRDEVEGSLAKAKLDRGSSELNTYLTLKKEAQQAKAEKAQAKLEAQVAMGKQASDDYFNQAKLDIERGKLDLSARKLDLDTQDKLDKWRTNAAKMTLEKRKQYMKEKIAGLSPSVQKQVYKYYNPKTGTITTSTSGQFYGN